MCQITNAVALFSPGLSATVVFVFVRLHVGLSETQREDSEE